MGMITGNEIAQMPQKFPAATARAVTNKLFFVVFFFVLFFLARAGELAVGFAQCALRHDYVEGTCSSPVGYLEGIYVAPACRHRGFARALLRACENWAEEMGCTEFASDCELTNSDSYAFHKSMGFAEANRIICFTKKLTSDSQ